MDRLLNQNDTTSDEAMQPLRDPEDMPSGTISSVLRPARRNLYFATLCINLSAVTAGCTMGWSSPSTLKLIDEKIITVEEATWLTAYLAIGAALGPFLAYKFVDHIGRKKTIIFDMFLFLLSWAVMGFAPLISSSVNSESISLVNIMYFGRLISGIAVGCIFTVSPMYVAEISDTEVRNALGSLIQLFLVVGFLIEYCIGPYFSLTVLTVASIIPPALCLLSFIFIPETPLYLLSQGNTESAQNSLRWFRQKHDVYREILEIQKSLDEYRNTDVCSWYKLFTTRGHLKCLYYGLCLIFFQQLSGINIVLFYAETIFSMTSSDLSPALSTILIGLVLLLSSTFTPILTRKYGIKSMLCFSSISSVIFQGVLGLYFYLQERKADLSSYQWLPVASIILYIIGYAVGLGPLPWAAMGDIYSPTIKTKASAISASICWLITFILTKYFQEVSHVLGPYICFWSFSFVCIISFIFVKFQLPELQGLSLQQIQDVLYNR